MLCLKTNFYRYVKIKDLNIENIPDWMFNATNFKQALNAIKSRKDIDYVIKNDKGFLTLLNKNGFESAFIKVPEDFKERFYIEYKELEDRSNKLSAMLEKWRNNSLNFTPNCPYELLEKQLQVMLEYKKILEERAKIEEISLE